jgi:hypothetical protein
LEPQVLVQDVLDLRLRVGPQRPTRLNRRSLLGVASIRKGSLVIRGKQGVDPARRGRGAYWWRHER